MEDANIYIRNQLGAKSGAQQKLSAKGSIERAKNTLNSANSIKTVESTLSSTLGHISSGTGSNTLTKGISKAGLTSGLLAAIIAGAEKVVSFGIDLKYSGTGERIWANNSKATLKTALSLGTNFIYGGFQNELFIKKELSRQNFGLDYYREIYNINMEGSKNKRI